MSERPSLLLDDLLLAERVRWARSRWERARGLLGSPLNPREALVIDGAHQVHTFGMTYPIDVLFCDDSWEILHCVRSMKPWRVTRLVRPARYVVELPAGTLPSSASGRLTLR